MTKFIFILSVFVLGATIISVYFYHKGPTIITGSVTDMRKRPIPGTIITVTPGNYIETVDDSGHYKIDKIQVGNYIITATTGNYNKSIEVSVRNRSYIHLKTIFIEFVPEITVDIQLDVSISSNTNTNTYTYTYNEAIDRIFYYSFNENRGDIIYDSIGKKRGVIYGAEWVRGISGSALEFDGIDDYIMVMDGKELYTDEFTISVWVYPYKYGGQIINKGTWNYHRGSWQLFMMNDGRLKLSISDGKEPSWPGVLGYRILKLNTWNHIVGIYKKLDNYSLLSIYIDGILDISATILRYPQHSSERMNIGAYYHYENKKVFNNFTGIIDEISIYNRALSEDEIKQIYKKYKHSIN
jgi:hypothetical protein